MISYAQNFEDVILQRVFRDRKDGFYIDVGAWDPVIDSVTKFFYEEGWSGINVEPNELLYKKLVQERPRDINLNVAVGETEENREFYVFEEYGNATFDQSSRDRFAEEGHEAEKVSVKVSTLAAICRQHVTTEIDFLKIDCEGWEERVLKGGDWLRFRPTVLIVEATQPGTSIPAWEAWELFVTEACKYEMAYFDGLNRFYLKQEAAADLRHHFDRPPNVFDDFKVYATAKAEENNRALAYERQDFQQRAMQAQDESARLQNELSAAQNRVRELNCEVLKTRLWVGQLSQELAACKKR